MVRYKKEKCKINFFFLDCDPRVADGILDPTYPCGIVSDTQFNDSLALYKNDKKMEMDTTEITPSYDLVGIVQ